MIIQHVAETEAQESVDLNITERGEGGFGSTGVKVLKIYIHKLILIYLLKFFI